MYLRVHHDILRCHGSILVLFFDSEFLEDHVLNDRTDDIRDEFGDVRHKWKLIHDVDELLLLVCERIQLEPNDVLHGFFRDDLGLGEFVADLLSNSGFHHVQLLVVAVLD